jgi:hypothetical protein
MTANFNGENPEFAPHPPSLNRKSRLGHRLLLNRQN